MNVVHLKCRSWTKKTIAYLVCLALSTLLYIAFNFFSFHIAKAEQKKDGQHGNGGMGLYIDGKYLTWSEVVRKYDLSTQGTPLSDDEIPGYSKLIYVIQKMPLSEHHKGRFLASILASGTRLYYKITSCDKENRYEKRCIDDRKNIKNIHKLYLQQNKNLLDKFKHFSKSEMKIKKQTSKVKKGKRNRRNRRKTEQFKFILYAFTDIAKRDTFIMPEFYFLTELGQTAALAHENFWLIKKNATYEDLETIVMAEIKFQDYLIKNSDILFSKREDVFLPFDPALYLSLNKVFNDDTLSFFGAVLDDFNNKRFEQLVSTPADFANGIPLSQFIGTQNLFTDPNNPNETTFDSDILITHLLTQITHYPNIQTFKQLQNNNKIKIKKTKWNQNMSFKSIPPVFKHISELKIKPWEWSGGPKSIPLGIYDPYNGVTTAPTVSVEQKTIPAATLFDTKVSGMTQPEHKGFNHNGSTVLSVDMKAPDAPYKDMQRQEEQREVY